MFHPTIRTFQSTVCVCSFYNRFYHRKMSQRQPVEHIRILVDNLKKKNEIIRNSSKNSKWEKALKRSFDKYVIQTLIMEGIPGNDKLSRRGVEKATREFEKFRLGELNVKDFCYLHECLIGMTNPSIAGKLRREEVVVLHPKVAGRRRIVSPTPHPSLVPNMFTKFLIMMNHPVNEPLIHASLSKLYFVHIHPYADGNGRLSRIILNGLLRRAHYPYVVIPVNETQEYFGAIRKFRGNFEYQTFLLYSLKCINKSVDLFMEDLK